MEKTRLVLIFLLFASCVIVDQPLYAGFGYDIKCSSCGFNGELFYGCGMVSKVIANGYCYNCDKFVSHGHGTAKNEEGLYQNYDGSTWETLTEEDVKAMQEPIGHVYCPDSKEKRALYPCPDCSGNFVQIKEDDLGSIENPITLYCPKCNKKTLNVNSGILWD
ncbi:MAG: hypothetical protein ISS26_00045 [Candidatus Omnitrophica bacterium]|nr:hypothetical protein [Candidatus Omnitrophota bacterium]